MAIGTNFIDISWTAALDNIAVTGYNVYDENGVFIKDVGLTLETTMDGLEPETEYFFKTKAYDAANNLSDFSNTVSGTTAKQNYVNEYQAILDYANSNGIIIPSKGVQLLQNQVIIDLKDNNLWDKMEFLYVPANDGSYEFSKINWINVNKFYLQGNGTPLWVSKKGFGANGSQNFNTGFNHLVDRRLVGDLCSTTIYFDNVTGSHGHGFGNGSIKFSAVGIRVRCVSHTYIYFNSNEYQFYRPNIIDIKGISQMFKNQSYSWLYIDNNAISVTGRFVRGVEYFSANFYIMAYYNGLDGIVENILGGPNNLGWFDLGIDGLAEQPLKHNIISNYIADVIATTEQVNQAIIDEDKNSALGDIGNFVLDLSKGNYRTSESDIAVTSLLNKGYIVLTRGEDVTYKKVLLINNSNEALISSKGIDAKIETNLNTEMSEDFSQLNINNVPELPLEGEQVFMDSVYKDNGIIFICIQEHLMTHFPAIDTPNLFRQHRAQGLPWEQPISTNPYQISDWVTHNGDSWKSIIKDNVWEPGTTGTENIWELFDSEI